MPSDTRIKIDQSTDFTTRTEQYYQQSESLAKSEREIFVVRHIIHLTIIICTLKGIECHFKLTWDVQLPATTSSHILTCWSTKVN